MNSRCIGTAAILALTSVCLPLSAQNFGMAKTKVTLQRKLPALVQLPGSTIRVRVTAHPDQADLASDLQAQLETELLKDDPHLQAEENDPATTVNCQITQYSHPQRSVSGEGAQANTRITGSINVAFQAKARDGRVIGSSNVNVNYDQDFDVNGNNVSHGIMGGLSSSWHRLKGSSGNDNSDEKPPTDSELRSLLLDSAVHRIAENIVNTSESIDVFLAKNKGPIDEGDKEAEAGLWERALETFETAKPLTKKDEDAYRLYDIGVANEALGYAASEPKIAMKFLDEAAINYGKAIDAKPSEKYFLGPQKRIETAIAHYRKLEEAKNAPPPPPPPPAAAPTPAPEVASAPVKKTSSPSNSLAKNSPPRSSSRSSRMQPAVTSQDAAAHGTTESAHALTDFKIIAMVKDGIDDDTLEQTVRNAKAVNFDLSAAGRQRLAAGGVSPAVISAMKARAEHSPDPK